MPKFAEVNIENLFMMFDHVTVKRAIKGLSMCFETQQILDDFYYFFNHKLRFVRLVPIKSNKDQLILVQKKTPFPDDGTRKVDPEGWEKEFGSDNVG